MCIRDRPSRVGPPEPPGYTTHRLTHTRLSSTGPRTTTGHTEPAAGLGWIVGFPSLRRNGLGCGRVEVVGPVEQTDRCCNAMRHERLLLAGSTDGMVPARPGESAGATG